MSDPEPGNAGEDDRKPLLHTVRKWLSGPDAGAERDTNSGRLHQSAVAMAAAVYLAGGVAHGQQGPNISVDLGDHDSSCQPTRASTSGAAILVANAQSRREPSWRKWEDAADCAFGRPHHLC